MNPSPTQPPRPPVDMSPTDVESRLRQVTSLHRLGPWLTRRSPHYVETR